MNKSSPLNTVTPKIDNRFVEYAAKQNSNYNFYNKVGIDTDNMSAPEDPLPQFSMLLNAPSLSVDMGCGLSSPYGQALSTPQTPQAALAQLSNLSQNSSQLSQHPHQPTCQESPTIPLQTNISSQITPMSSNHTVPQQSVQQSIESLIITSSPNVNMEQQHAIMNQAYNNEQHQQLSAQLRTILPKPNEHVSSNLSLMSVLPPSIASTMLTPTNSSIANSNNNNNITSDQLSPGLKMEERFNVHNITIPPNQIFTKMNILPPSSSVTSLNQRTLLQNITFPPNFQNLLSPQSTEQMQRLQQHLQVQRQQQKQQQQQHQQQQQQQHQQHQTSDVLQQQKQNRQYSSINEVSPVMFEMNVGKEVLQRQPCDAPATPQGTAPVMAKRRGSKHSDNGGGQLEVASALLSMGTENDSGMDISTTEDVNKLQDQDIDKFIGDQLKNDESNIPFENDDRTSTIKVNDVEIDPNFHILKKGERFCKELFYLLR